MPSMATVHLSLFVSSPPLTFLWGLWGGTPDFLLHCCIPRQQSCEVIQAEQPSLGYPDDRILAEKGVYIWTLLSQIPSPNSHYSWIFSIWKSQRKAWVRGCFPNSNGCFLSSCDPFSLVDWKGWERNKATIPHPLWHPVCLLALWLYRHVTVTMVPLFLLLLHSLPRPGCLFPQIGMHKIAQLPPSPYAGPSPLSVWTFFSNPPLHTPSLTHPAHGCCSVQQW